MRQGDQILGVDGGGTKTVACLAVIDPHDQPRVIGRGRAGSSNCRSVGDETATENLRRAVELAFEDAGLSREIVASACLALAGADRPVEQTRFRSWAEEQQLARELTITNDALPVLYAACDDGVGIALISGTGSVAIGRNSEGEVARCGGWGNLIGDEGSGYRIGLAALRAAAQSADGRIQKTSLLQDVLDHFDIDEPTGLIPIIYSPETTRATIALLAPLTFRAAASGDRAATQIIDHAAADLSELVMTLATRLGMATSGIALGVSGGVLLHQTSLVDAICDRLRGSGIDVRVTPVPEPVAGALKMAAKERY